MDLQRPLLHIGAKDLAIFLDAARIGRRAADFDCSLAVDVGDIFAFLGG